MLSSHSANKEAACMQACLWKWGIMEPFDFRIACLMRREKLEIWTRNPLRTF